MCLNKSYLFVLLRQWLYSVWSASHSLESLNIVLAWVYWITIWMIFIASFHSFQNLRALLISNVEWSSREVWSKEVSEGWSLNGSSRHHSKWHSGGPGVWSWWREQSAIRNVESLHIWMSKISLRSEISSLEWMSCNHQWMGMIYRQSKQIR